jgi:hypothetical protein
VVWCQPAGSPPRQDSGMERVLGIGGSFIRAGGPERVVSRLPRGLDADENGLWRQGAGLTVIATFESETDYFGPAPSKRCSTSGSAVWMRFRATWMFTSAEDTALYGQLPFGQRSADPGYRRRLPRRPRKCHESETDLDAVAVRHTRTRRSNKINMSRGVRTYNNNGLLWVPAFRSKWVALVPPP